MERASDEAVKFNIEKFNNCKDAKRDIHAKRQESTITYAA